MVRETKEMNMESLMEGIESAKLGRVVLVPNVALKQMHQCRATFINLTHACCVATSHLTVLSLPTQWNWLEPLFCLFLDVKICAQCSKVPLVISSLSITKNKQRKNEVRQQTTKDPEPLPLKVLLSVNMEELRVDRM